MFINDHFFLPWYSSIGPEQFYFIFRFIQVSSCASCLRKENKMFMRLSVLDRLAQMSMHRYMVILQLRPSRTCIPSLFANNDNNNPDEKQVKRLYVGISA